MADVMTLCGEEWIMARLVLRDPAEPEFEC